MTSHSPLLSHSHIRLRALSSPRSPSLIGWGVAGAPPRITIHRFVRSVAGATPQGARCVELRLEPQLEAARSLTSHCSPRLASLASPRLPSTRLARLALLRPHLGFLLDSPCLARLASPLHSLASPPRSPDLLARLASLRSSAAAPLATLSVASLAGSGGGGVDEAACLHMPSKKAPCGRRPAGQTCRAPKQGGEASQLTGEV